MAEWNKARYFEISTDGGHLTLNEIGHYIYCSTKNLIFVQTYNSLNVKKSFRAVILTNRIDKPLEHNTWIISPIIDGELYSGAPTHLQGVGTYGYPYIEINFHYTDMSKNTSSSVTTYSYPETPDESYLAKLILLRLSFLFTESTSIDELKQNSRLINMRIGERSTRESYLRNAYQDLSELSSLQDKEFNYEYCLMSLNYKTYLQEVYHKKLTLTKMVSERCIEKLQNKDYLSDV